MNKRAKLIFSSLIIGLLLAWFGPHFNSRHYFKCYGHLAYPYPQTSYGSPWSFDYQECAGLNEPSPKNGFEAGVFLGDLILWSTSTYLLLLIAGLVVKKERR